MPGRKGMKWGQNIFTKGRLSRGTRKRPKRKRVEEMTTEELKTAVNRMRLEVQYKQLLAQTNNSRYRRSSDALADILKQSGRTSVQNFATKAITNALNNRSKK